VALVCALIKTRTLFNITNLVFENKLPHSHARARALMRQQQTQIMVNNVFGTRGAFADTRSLFYRNNDGVICKNSNNDTV
jgi:hypothetical protein